MYDSANDIEIKCIGCGKNFIFTTRDQDFYAEKGYSDPKRCYSCRKAKKLEREKNDR